MAGPGEFHQIPPGSENFSDSKFVLGQDMDMAVQSNPTDARGAPKRRALFGGS